MKFTKEMLEKAKQCKTAEELMALAKENGFEMTEQDLVELANALKGELPDDVLENVAGGFILPYVSTNRYRKTKE